MIAVLPLGEDELLAELMDVIPGNAELVVASGAPDLQVACRDAATVIVCVGVDSLDHIEAALDVAGQGCIVVARCVPKVVRRVWDLRS